MGSGSTPYEGPPRAMSLLDADPGFASAVPAAHRGRARRYLTFDIAQLGRWQPVQTDRETDLGALVVDGFLLGHTRLGDRRAAFIHGPGDVLPAGPLEGSMSALPVATRLTVLRPVTLLLLDERFWTACGHWPGLGGLLHGRLHDMLAAERILAAINAFARVDERLLALLWYFADRWGTVRSDGVHIALPLTHRALGELVGSRRPTVTLALGELAERGLVRRQDDGGYVLDLELMDALTADWAAAGGSSGGRLGDTGTFSGRGGATPGPAQ